MGGPRARGKGQGGEEGTEDGKGGKDREGGEGRENRKIRSCCDQGRSCQGLRGLSGQARLRRRARWAAQEPPESTDCDQLVTSLIGGECQIDCAPRLLQRMRHCSVSGCGCIRRAASGVNLRWVPCWSMTQPRK